MSAPAFSWTHARRRTENYGRIRNSIDGLKYRRDRRALNTTGRRGHWQQFREYAGSLRCARLVQRDNNDVAMAAALDAFNFGDSAAGGSCFEWHAYQSGRGRQQRNMLHWISRGDDRCARWRSGPCTATAKTCSTPIALSKPLRHDRDIFSDVMQPLDSAQIIARRELISASSASRRHARHGAQWGVRDADRRPLSNATARRPGRDIEEQKALCGA